MIKIGKLRVNTLDARCGERECFQLGFDKGSFVQGRGYVSYHQDAKGRRVERPVCMTRHLRGCPIGSVCADCRLCSVDGPGAKCPCGGTTIDRR